MVNKIDPNTSALINKYFDDAGILSPKVLAYAYATMEVETAGTMQPIAEYGGRSQARKLGYNGGENYYGRGYIQLTGKNNYKKYGDILGIDLVNNPDLALQPDIAARIMAAFFKETGVDKAVEKGNLIGARAPINGSDRAQEIAQNSKNYYNDITKNQDKYFVSTETDQLTKKNQFPFNLLSSPVNAAYDTSSTNNAEQSGTLKGQPKTWAEQQSDISKLGNIPLKTNQAVASDPNQNSSLYNPTSNPVATANKTVTVKKGDTLWGIAQQLLGSGTLWKQLQGYSGNPKNLQVGTTISTQTKTPTPAPVKQASTNLSSFTPLATAIKQPVAVKPNYISWVAPAYKPISNYTSGTNKSSSSISYGKIPMPRKLTIA